MLERNLKKIPVSGDLERPISTRGAAAGSRSRSRRRPRRRHLPNRINVSYSYLSVPPDTQSFGRLSHWKCQYDQV